MWSYKLASYFLIAFLLFIFAIFEIIQKRRQKNFFQEKKIINLISWLISSSIIIFDLLLISYEYNRKAINSANFLIVLVTVVITFFLIKNMWNSKTFSVYNITENKLEEILLEVFVKYELKPQKKVRELDTVIELELDETHIKISEGTFGNSFTLKFINVNNIYSFENIILDLREKIIENSKVSRFRGIGEFGFIIAFIAVAIWLY